MIVFLKLSLAIPLILSLRNPAFTKRQSHPAGVRVLKRQKLAGINEGTRSHPAGVRVLKPPSIRWFLWGVLVAPRRGACVETTKTERKSTATSSHPAGVRVLKPSWYRAKDWAKQSHPAGVRVLKLAISQCLRLALQSHPAGVRVLKPPRVAPRRHQSASHPAGVRVLKHEIEQKQARRGAVAPRRGACVETPPASRSTARRSRRTPQGCVC